MNLLPIAAEIFITRAVDNFNVYISDMLRVFLREKPGNLPQKVKRGKPQRVIGIGERC